MFKKCGVAVILSLIMASFVMGPISAVVVQASAIEAAPAGAFFSAPWPCFGGALPEGPVHYTKQYTTVVLDLSDPGDGGHTYLEKREVVGVTYMGSAQGKLPPMPFFASKADFIRARMIVQMAGSDTPQVFPVQFARHTAPSMPEKTPEDFYKTSLAFKTSHDEAGRVAGLVMYSTDGPTPPDASGDMVFTFNGVITASGGVVTASGIVNDTQKDTYSNGIVDGQTVWHQAEVSGKSLNVDLKWQNASDDLQLTIYTPDGHILGPYGDEADGKSDGRINLEISDHGDVADGTWSFKVQGADVAGKDEYYMRTW
jgi:hypothetical protein